MSAPWFGPGIDCAITQHIETIYVQYIYLFVKYLGLFNFYHLHLSEEYDMHS